MPKIKHKSRKRKPIPDDEISGDEHRKPTRPNKKKKRIDSDSETLSEASQETESSAEIMTGSATDLIKSIVARHRKQPPDNDVLNQSVRDETIKDWCANAEQGKIRKTKINARAVYDKIYQPVAHAQILASNMPMRAMCAAIQLRETLEILTLGTEEYFSCKEQLDRIMRSYDDIQCVPLIEQARVFSALDEIPTRTDILARNISTGEKIHILEKMDQMDRCVAGSEDYTQHKHDIINMLCGRDNNMATLRAKIMAANCTERNRALMLEACDMCTGLSPGDESREKKIEWIKWALCITEDMVGLPVTRESGPHVISKFLASVKTKLDEQLYGMQQIKEQLIEIFASMIHNPNTKESAIGIVGPPGVGKCLDPKTPVLLYGGGVKYARDISVDDLLIGDDNTPRRVLSTTSGVDIMYDIILANGEMFRVNAPHVITLCDSDGCLSDMPLDEFLKRPLVWRKKQRMAYANILYGPSTVCGQFNAPCVLAGKQCVARGYVVHELKYANREVRAQVLRGIVAELHLRKSDDALERTTDSISLYQTGSASLTVNVQLDIRCGKLRRDVKFIARSLGYRVQSKKTCVTIYGDINQLPCVNCRDTSSFTVAPAGHGVYCGFTLDGNGRFVLGNGVITHNTHLIQSIAQAIQLPFKKINMGGKVDPSHFLGHNYTYIGAQPGVIVKAIKHLKGKRGIIYFDEFDKIDSSTDHKAGLVAQAFLHISDPVQQKDFQDDYLGDIEIDLSNILFIYSFNDARAINPILLNRIPVIQIEDYSTAEKITIARQYIVPALLANEGLQPTDITFSDAAYSWLIKRAAEQDAHGLRIVRQIATQLIKKINLLVMTNCDDNPLRLSYDLRDKSYPIHVGTKIAQKLYASCDSGHRDNTVLAALYV